MNDLYPSLLELARRRKSCRSFRETDTVGEAEVEQLLAVAARSPFASGRSQWKVAVVRERERIRALAAEVRARAEALAAGMDAEQAAFFRRYAQSFCFFEQAPLLLVPYCRETATMKSMLRENATPDILEWEHDNLTKSLSCVSMMLLLAAESLGLGACYMTGPLLAGKAVNGALGLQDFFLVGAIIPVGHKEEAAR
jgi:nitroreductase